MKLCSHCNSTFVPKHGNQQYCSGVCHKSQKAATQQKLYGILKEFRKGFLTNYKLFEQLLLLHSKERSKFSDNPYKQIATDLQPYGPIEEAIQKSIIANSTSPKTSYIYLRGVLVTVLAGGIIYWVISKNKSKKNQPL